MTNWGSTRRAVDLVSGKWVLAVLAAFADGTPRRVAGIHRGVGPVSAKVLNETLHRMHTTGLITRTPVPANSGHHVAGYTLTPAGQALLAPLAELGTWYDAQHTARQDPAPTP